MATPQRRSWGLDSLWRRVAAGAPNRRAHRYAPARDTLANGLRSRAAECGYDVTEYVDTDAPDRPLNLQRGDVAIWIGAMHRKKFVVPKWVLKKGHAAISTATRLRNRGVYVIEYLRPRRNPTRPSPPTKYPRRGRGAAALASPEDSHRGRGATTT